MPIYEYLCDACGKRSEQIQKFSDPPIEACPACGGGPVRRLMSSPAIQFKGSGWYITDYAKKGADSSKEKAESEKSAKAESADTKAATADTKSTASSETKAATSDAKTSSSDSGSAPSTAAPATASSKDAKKD